MGPGFESLKVHHKWVILTQRVHPFPFRTRKLSSAVPKILAWRRVGKIGQCWHTLVGVSNAEGPPVPIPNTEVKLCSAENTCLATDREDRSMLTQIIFVFLSSTSFPLKGKQSVFLTQRVHPFPFRTRKLSSAVATILVWRRTGKIAHCRHIKGIYGNPVYPFKNFTRKSVKIRIPN